jgi:hypothetical protein
MGYGGTSTALIVHIHERQAVWLFSSTSKEGEFPSRVPKSMKMTWYLRDVPEGLVARGVYRSSTMDYSAAGSEVFIVRGESFCGHSWAELQEQARHPGYFAEDSDGKETITVGGEEYAPDDRWEDAILEGLNAGVVRGKQREAVEKAAGKKLE